MYTTYAPAALPFETFDKWLLEATATEVNDPTAAALATISPQGLPEVRMVLVRQWGPTGFVFCTNRDSIKGQALAVHPHASLCWHWKSLRRQVRLSGPVTMLTDDEVDTIFAARARASQIGAWASLQSRPLVGRAALEARIHEYTSRFEGQTVPRPPYWVGYRVMPVQIEFWQEKDYRLHDRILYRLSENGWTHEALFP